MASTLHTDESSVMFNLRELLRLQGEREAEEQQVEVARRETEAQAQLAAARREQELEAELARRARDAEVGVQRSRSSRRSVHSWSVRLCCYACS